MILITGMPRAGTTFLLRQFAAHGSPYFVDMHYPEKKYIQNEPAIFSKGISEDLVSGYEAYWWNKHPGKEIVVKHHGFRAHKHSSSWFSSVIVCVRQVDSWLKSASEHPVTPQQAKAAGLPLLEYGNVIYSASKAYYEAATEKKAVLFDFNDPDKAFQKINARYGLDYEDLVRDWRGSRHEGA